MQTTRRSQIELSIPASSALTAFNTLSSIVVGTTMSAKKLVLTPRTNIIEMM